MTIQNNNNRQAFTFYRSFYDALKTLPASSRLELYDAILSLSFDELEPCFKLTTSKRFWALIRPNLLTSLKNWKNGCQPKRSQKLSQNEATPSLKIKTKNKIIDKEEKNRIRTAFEKPTIQEVEAHIKDKGYHFKGIDFMSYYESNGWRVGRNPMKCWKSACITWQRKSESTININGPIQKPKIIMGGD